MRRAHALVLAATLATGAVCAQTPPPKTDAKPAKVADTLEQRLLACAICHGKQGEGVRKNEYYPRLAGKPVEYLYNQLIGFREKRRSSSPIMTYMVGSLSDNYLHEIAAYYSALKTPYPEPTPRAEAEKLQLGQELAMRGDKARDIPACASCHSAGLTGLLPGIPGLLGLYPDYIGAQLGAWKNGKRNSKAPDCMARVASRLSGEDISAVSQYLASLTVATNVPPAPAQPAKLPLECGSAR
jgi:cytochrome c553